MKQQFIVTHRHTMRQEKLDRSSTDQQLKHVFLYKNMRTSNIFVDTTLTEGVFVTNMSSNATISIWRIVWVMTNCRFMGRIAF